MGEGAKSDLVWACETIIPKLTQDELLRFLPILARLHKEEGVSVEDAKRVWDLAMKALGLP